MSSEKSKRKVLIVSLLVFLISGGGIFTFFIFQSLEDLKKQPGFEFEYNSFPKKALLPILKYAGIVDQEVMSVKDNVNVASIDNAKEIILEGNKNNIDASGPSSLAPSRNKNYSSQSGGYYSPPNKLSSGISGGSFAGSGGSQTSGSLSKFSSGNVNKEVSISQNALDSSKMNTGAKNLMARLQATRNTMAEAYKSGSASDAKYKWDKSFMGSSGGGHSMMFSGGGITKLDKIDAGINGADLKVSQTQQGLNAPDPGEPKVDKEANAKDPVKQKAEEAAKDMVKSLLSGMSNTMAASTINNKNPQGSQEDYLPDSKSIEENQQVLDKIKKMTLDSDAKVKVGTLSNGDYVVEFYGHDETGDYIDTYIISSDGKRADFVPPPKVTKE